MKSVMSGSRSVATAVMSAKPEVIAAFPITPQTEMVEDISTFIADGMLNSKFIKVDSEHSAMAACIGASSGGARTFTATSSHGLMYMSEAVYWAAHARLPIVMAVATRALAAPWSILNEHTDFMMQLGSGWIQIMVENNQEAFDTTIQAFKIAEDKEILLPVMLGLDGFILTHTNMPVNIPDSNIIDSFLGKRKSIFDLDIKNPITMGNVVDQNYFMELRHKMFRTMQNAKEIIRRVSDEYAKLTGRTYGLIDLYNCDDAEHILITMGASSGDAKVATDMLRKEGIKVGLLRLRVIRPFPSDEIVAAIGNAATVSIVERALSPGIGNILAHEVKSVLYGNDAIPFVKSYIGGLGGRDITPADYVRVVKSSISRKEGDEWINLKSG